MEINEVNEDANYAIQAHAQGEWHAITNEYSASAAYFVAENIFNALRVDARVISKRNNQVIFDFKNDRIYDTPTTD
jgi:DNA polymerase III delta prime subunit